jgi:glycerate kinase
MPMSGCAGGLSGALWACYGAHLRSGADEVLDAVGFDARAAATGRVVTGEGSLDVQSADGKLVSVVAARAGAVGARTWAIAGRVRLAADELSRLGLAGTHEATTLTGIRAAAERLAVSS